MSTVSRQYPESAFVERITQEAVMPIYITSSMKGQVWKRLTVTWTILRRYLFYQSEEFVLIVSCKGLRVVLGRAQYSPEPHTLNANSWKTPNLAFGLVDWVWDRSSISIGRSLVLILTELLLCSTNTNVMQWECWCSCAKLSQLKTNVIVFHVTH